MQPPDRLILFLPLLLPGMWADPEAEPQVLQFLQTSFFTNSSSAEVFVVALLGDVPIFTLDPDNWSTHFHWPWALQATAEGDMEKIKGQVKPFLRNMVRYIHTVVWQAQRDCTGGLTWRDKSCPWPQSLPARPDQTSSCSFAASPASTHGPSAWLGCRMARRCHWAQRSTPVPSCPTQTSPTSSASPWPWPSMTGTAMPAACATAAWAPAVSSSRGKTAAQLQPSASPSQCCSLWPQPLLHGFGGGSTGSCKLHIFQTFVFHNTNFVDTSGWATLEDIVFARLRKPTRDIQYLYPWVYPSLPAAEWDNLKNLFNIYMHNLILSLLGDAKQYQIPYPFVFQCATGCNLYPNGSYTKFYHLAYNSHSFLSFNVDNILWERQQESELAMQVERKFTTFTGFSETAQHLLNVTCVDHMKKFIEYGRASLERQELPVATVFARTPRPDQLLLICRVTGFYPRPISVAWLQDGQEVPPGPALNTSAILPNADLTYQLRITLAVALHDGHSYACRVRHRSLGTHSLLIPWGSSNVALSVGITITVLLTMAAVLAGAICHYRRRH
ncbi:antigen-presenting glycoprotein CD1d-like [Strix uralensis]|uniref:antigen-presenting glycoprotein CD1d-like n=1 Tax=Strix uralensis TaxID=36305 RepID=UPI003DA29A08